MEVYIQPTSYVVYNVLKRSSPSKSRAKRRKTRNDLSLTKSQSNDYFALKSEASRERSCTIAEPFSTETETLTQEMRDRVLHNMISRPELFRNTSSPAPNPRLSKIEVSTLPNICRAIRPITVNLWLARHKKSFRYSPGAIFIFCLFLLNK